MGALKPRFNLTQISELASRYSEGLSREDASEEQAAVAIGDLARQTGEIGLKELTQLAAWKSPRIAHLIPRNRDQDVRAISRVALGDFPDQQRVPLLSLLHGVAWPMASVILHLCHREVYPIADIRAFWAMGAEEMPDYSPEVWLEYVSAVRLVCQKTGATPRDADRALWQFAYEQGRVAPRP